jgi:hypothetical protein
MLDATQTKTEELTAKAEKNFTVKNVYDALVEAEVLQQIPHQHVL